MALKLHPMFTDFSAGEVSPKFLGRADTDAYRKGSEKCENFIVLPTGGITRRDGTFFVSEVYDSARKTRIVPFLFSRTEAYILEFSQYLIRVYRFNGSVPERVPVVSITTPYLEADLFDLDLTPYRFDVYVCHPSYAPRKITRVAYNNWTINSYDDLGWPLNPTPAQTPDKGSYIQDATKSPYFDFADDVLGCPGELYPQVSFDLTGIPAYNPAVDVTATYVGTGTFRFQPTDVGSIFRTSRLIPIFVNADPPAGTIGFWKIVSYTNPTTVTVRMLTAVSGYGTPTAGLIVRWVAWGGRTSFPRCSCVHEQRLYFGGVAKRAQTVFTSKVGDFENLDNGVSYNDLSSASAMQFSLESQDVSPIVWMESMRVLLVGTESTEYRVSSVGGAITPTDIDAKRQTSHGAKSPNQLMIGNTVFFVQRSGTKLRRLEYNEVVDNYIADDMTTIADHIGTDIKTPAYQQEKNSTVWTVDSDGQLKAMTYKPELKITAWHRHSTDGEFESVAVIPSADGAYDTVWVVAKRTINSVTKRYVEVMIPGYITDSCVRYAGFTGSTITGLSHLEGKTVHVCRGGSYLQTATVTSGAVTLSIPVTTASTMEVGLNFVSTLKTTQPEGLNPSGTSQGRPKHFAELVARVYQTNNVLLNGQRVIFQLGNDIGGVPAPLYTGDKKVVDLGWETGAIEVKQDLPFQCTLLCLYGTMNVGI
jgi:hypothetical protein